MIWFYPTRFSETSCITALEAQAAGCCVVTSKLAALEETASSWSLLEGSNKSPGYQEKALDQITHYLAAWDLDKKITTIADEGRGDCNSPGHLTAQAARAWALGQTWAAVARDWDDDFLSMIHDKDAQCNQCGAVVEGYHACQGVPGWEEGQ